VETDVGMIDFGYIVVQVELRGKGCRILVVDDRLMICEGVKGSG